MTNKLARILFVGTLLLLSLSSVMAKGDKEGSETVTVFEGSANNPYQITAEPLNLKIWFHARNSIVYKEDWPVEQEARKMTNVYLESVAPQNSTSSIESFQIHLATGQLADIIGLDAGRDHFMTYGMEGAFEPLNDLIDMYAPDIKKVLDAMPSLRNYITAPDGNIYFIPYIADGTAAGGYFIRQDWLDALNLEVPKNVDDFYNVLKAFKERDPNGNGKDDEIPYFDRATGAAEVFRLVTLWGGHSEEFYVENGKVKYSFVQEEFKEGIKNLAKWYKEGLIDSEVLTRGKKSRDILFGNNTGGATHDWFGSTLGYNQKLSKQVPGFKLVTMAPPVNTKGKQIEEFARTPYKPDGWAMSSTNKHKIETMKYMNFWFTEAGRRLSNFGIEGLQYDMIDGKPVFKSEILNSTTNVTDQLWNIGAQIPKGFYQDFEYERQWLTPDAKLGMEMYMDNGYIQSPYPVLALTPAEKEAYDKVHINIKTYVDEIKIKWLLGAEDVDKTWEEFVNTLNDYGLKTLVDTQQSAYNRLK